MHRLQQKEMSKPVRGTRRDKREKNALHFYPVYPYDADQRKAHDLMGQSCWCKTRVTTDWEKASTNEPYIFIHHEGVPA